MKDKIIKFNYHKDKIVITDLHYLDSNDYAKIPLGVIITKILPELEREFKEWKKNAWRKCGHCGENRLINFVEYLKAKYTK